MISEDRVSRLNTNEITSGKYVIYWMQSSVRTQYNYALEYAIDQANKLGKTLLTCFIIDNEYPGANLRHYKFLLEGISEVKKSLEDRNIEFIVRIGFPPSIITILSKDAALIVVDRGYTEILKKWRTQTAAKIKCPLIQVEDNVVIPVETASNKEEYSAYTLRRKITPLLDHYLKPLRKKKLESTFEFGLDSIDISDLNSILNMLDIDRSIKPVEGFIGGSSNASQLLQDFIDNRLDEYHKKKNDPTIESTSNLSPYLHFGQISPIFIALKIKQTESFGSQAFLEELIVRRELAVNFVHYNPLYESIKCLPDWCRKTLKEHEKDTREYLYSLSEFESAETHDPYWNAAQSEMIKTGKMHGYMRMYWGKKILEWTQNPRKAYEIAVYLNDKYELDGRDPNGYSGIAWCFGKHDRPWKERAVFGKIRYMNDKGLRRKFDADKYVKMVGSI